MPLLLFLRDNQFARMFTSGIICGSGSFAVQFGDHLRSGDYLRSGIICSAVQLPFSVGYCNLNKKYTIALSNQQRAVTIVISLAEQFFCGF